MAGIIGKTGVNSAQQTGKVAVNEKTNKVKEKYTITPKQFVGGLLAGAVAFGGIAYAIKKKPAKITELLEQAKNLGSKNSDEVKKVNKFKKENLKTLDNLGVKFNKGVAEVDGQKFDGVIPLYTKKGYPIDAYYENGILTGKLNKATGEHTFINKSRIKIKKKGEKPSFIRDIYDNKYGGKTIIETTNKNGEVVEHVRVLDKKGHVLKDRPIEEFDKLKLKESCSFYPDESIV